MLSLCPKYACSCHDQKKNTYQDLGPERQNLRIRHQSVEFAEKDPKCNSQNPET